jgi:hypothetical protein
LENVPYSAEFIHVIKQGSFIRIFGKEKVLRIKLIFLQLENNIFFPYGFLIVQKAINL